MYWSALAAAKRRAIMPMQPKAPSQGERLSVNEAHRTMASRQNTAISNTSIDVRPLSSHVGAEIHGVDLAQPLEERTYREIRNALNDHGVIFFRDQDITPAQHLAFTARFGAPLVDEVSSGGHPDGFPEILFIGKEPEQTRNIGGNWHTDHSFDEIPPLGAVLVARELPAVGGDTLFASMYNAFDTLSDGLKKTLESLRAVHRKTRAYDALSSERAIGADERAKIAEKFAKLEVSHPVVRTHPESGRKLLYVNPTYTVRFDGWTEKESEPLLAYLYAHATRPENTCRFQWREGSIAFWDNRSSWHYALNDYHGARRMMHRITIDGTPFA
jgi:taurine dioxygenase